jgi:hypothetical protein
MNSLDDLIEDIEKKEKRWGFLWKLRPRYVWARITDTVYYVKCALWKRYNVVRVKTLPPTWTDRDNLLLHANFQILTDFLNKELHGRRPDPNYYDSEEFKEADPLWQESCRRRDAVEQELWDLNDWWHNERQRAWDSLYDGRMFCYRNRKSLSADEAELMRKASYDLEEALNRKDEQQLKRLIELRQYMWT